VLPVSGNVSITLLSDIAVNATDLQNTVSRLLNLSPQQVGIVNVSVRQKGYFSLANQPWYYDTPVQYASNVSFTEILDGISKSPPGTFSLIDLQDHPPLANFFATPARRKLLFMSVEVFIATTQAEAFRLVNEIYYKNSPATDLFFTVLRQKGLVSVPHSDIIWGPQQTTVQLNISGVTSVLATATLSSSLAIDIIAQSTNASVVGIVGGASATPPPFTAPSPPPQYLAPVDRGIHQSLVFFFSFLVLTLVVCLVCVGCYMWLQPVAKRRRRRVQAHTPAPLPLPMKRGDALRRHAAKFGPSEQIEIML